MDGRVFVIIFKYGVGELSLDDYVSKGEECGAIPFLVSKQRRAGSSNIKCKLIPSYNKFSVLDEDDEFEVDKKTTDTINEEEWTLVGCHKLKSLHYVNMVIIVSIIFLSRGARICIRRLLKVILISLEIQRT